mmetsp:Transcript_7544/g.9367  ORF Transcript_7544/g.9367 Transcript_7544/m.9367 type:complete len:207 (+) Transcript_7544:61-681(+)
MSKSESKEQLFVDSVPERLIEPGRICLIVYGKHYRELVCIIDFIDRNRVLCDGGNNSLSKIDHQAIPLKWLQCTKFRINIEKDAPSDLIKKIVNDTELIKKYKESAMGRRNECIKKKELLNDFERFKLYFIKKKFQNQVSNELITLRANKAGIKPSELKKKEYSKLGINPTLRRVTGRFRRKLLAKVIKKSINKRKKEKKYSRYFK